LATPPVRFFDGPRCFGFEIFEFEILALGFGFGFGFCALCAAALGAAPRVRCVGVAVGGRFGAGRWCGADDST
jgi:hypothetical protein